VPRAIGTYYLRVDGVGNGDPKKTGWSDYGSLGQYRLTSNGCATKTVQSSNAVQVSRPSPPRIGTASPGKRGGTSTALVRWLAPTSNGGAAVTKYRVLARRLDAQGRVVRSYGSAYLKPGARSLSMKLPKARYKFVVVAYNRVGMSPLSGYSNIVNAR
jgi:hypothetical protein